MKGCSVWCLCFLHCQNNVSCKVIYVVHFTNRTSGVWNETKLHTIKHNHYTYKHNLMHVIIGKTTKLKSLPQYALFVLCHYEFPLECMCVLVTWTQVKTLHKQQTSHI
jgi:hypothetical protein